MDARGELPPGTDVGGYRIVAPLGSGGMGTVYRAVDGGGTSVALKLLHPHVGADPVARDRLRREVAALQRLRHPGVAAVLDAEADSTEAFVVTQLVDGLTLEEHVQRGGPLPVTELAPLAAGLRDALEAVHAAGVVHRDLKPGNVMLTPHGPVLIDFGIAQSAEETRVTSTGFVVGTPGYLAPELLADAEPSARTDWWGWAAVLAFAATGRAPFGTRPLDAVLARTRAGDVDLAGVPRTVAAPLRDALEPEPSLRAMPDDVVADLERAASGAPPAPPTQVLPAGSAATAAMPSAATAAMPSAATAAMPSAATAAMPELTTPTVPRDGRTRALPAAAGGATAASAWDPGETAALPRHGPAPAAAGAGAALAEPWDDADDAVGWPPPHAAGPASDDESWPPPEPAPYVPTRLRRRSGSVLALALAVVAGATLYPGVTIGVLVAALLVFRTVGSADEALQLRRGRRGGATRGDVARAVATGPWHLLRAVVGLLPSVLVAASVVLVVGGVLWWALETGRLVVGATATSQGTNGPLAYAGTLALVALLAALTVWFGPLTRLTRAGARRVLAGVAPGWSGATVLVTAALATAAVLVVLLVTGQEPTWWPFAGPPRVG